MKQFLAVAAVAAAGSMSCAAAAATVTVSTAAQLDAALRAAKGGDIIRVASGNYGDFEIRGINPATAVTIISANSARPPVFTHLGIRDSSQLRFTRLNISSPAPDSSNPVRTSTEIYRSHDIRLSGVAFSGVPGGGVANEARGLRLSQSTSITIAGNSFNELSHGIVTDGSSRMTITDNAFSGMRIDGIIADGAAASLIARNRFSSFRPATGDHPDAIQIFNNYTPTTSLIVTDNLILGDVGGQMQGIFMTNSTGNRTQLDRITISGNLMWGTMWNGIAAFDANRLTVTGNTLFSNAALTSSKTWVRLEDVTMANVSGNFAGAYIYDDVGTLITDANLLSLAGISAKAAVALWDATHSASGLTVRYNNLSGKGGQSELQLASPSGKIGHGDVDFASLRTVAGVPEPASWLSMIAGFGIVGFARRRLQPKRARRIQPA